MKKIKITLDTERGCGVLSEPVPSEYQQAILVGDEYWVYGLDEVVPATLNIETPIAVAPDPTPKESA